MSAQIGLPLDGKPRCKIERCPSVARIRGMCSTHYGRWRRGDRGKELSRPPEKIMWREGCVVTGCKDPHRAKGLCSNHYDRWMAGDRGRRLARPVRKLVKNKGRRCRVRGCSRQALCRRLCDTHYTRWKRGDRGKMLERPVERNDQDHCEIDGCDGDHRSNGLCIKHYAYYNHRDGLAGWLYRAMKSGPCTDCQGWHPPYMTEFDHCRGEKEVAVSQVRTSIPDMMDEVWKVDPVCSNCHRWRTHRRHMEQL